MWHKRCSCHTPRLTGLILWGRRIDLIVTSKWVKSPWLKSKHINNIQNYNSVAQNLESKIIYGGITIWYLWSTSIFEIFGKPPTPTNKKLNTKSMHSIIIIKILKVMVITQPRKNSLPQNYRPLFITNS